MQRGNLLAVHQSLANTIKALSHHKAHRGALAEVGVCLSLWDSVRRFKAVADPSRNSLALFLGLFESQRGEYGGTNRTYQQISAHQPPSRPAPLAHRLEM